MRVSVLVPYRSDGGHRAATWAWLSARWAKMFPQFEIVTGAPSDPCPDPGQFNRHPTNAAQQALYNRYDAARGDRDAMSALIAER